MNTALDIQRTPEIIATEINGIKQQARIQFICNCIEVGRRLIEAKEMLPHGEWGKWLEIAVNYSQSTANNLMRIAEEYGSKQWSLFGADAKSQALGNLSYTQAVALLGIPSEEREEFIQENDIENMSTRELQKVIKERDQAIKQKEQVEKKLADKTTEAQMLQDDLKAAQEKAEQDAQKLEAAISELKAQINEAEKDGNKEEIDRLKSDLAEADALLVSANEEIADLNKQLEQKPIDVAATEVIEKIPEAAEKELEELRKGLKSVAVLKYTERFENLVKGFQDLLAALAEIKETDQSEHENYCRATLELINKMSARV